MATMTMSPKSNAKTQQSCATSIIVIVQEVDDTKGLEEGMEVAATMVATVVEGMEVEVTEEGMEEVMEEGMEVGSMGTQRCVMLCERVSPVMRLWGMV